MSQDLATATQGASIGRPDHRLIPALCQSPEKEPLLQLFSQALQIPLHAGAGGMSSWEPLLYPKIEKAKAQRRAFEQFIDLNFSLIVAGSATQRPN